jgi:cytoskeletal protein CcmA (bactofilin family)
MNQQNDESDSSSVFKAPVYGPVKIGPGDLHIGELHYGQQDYDVKPGQQHTGDIYRASVEELQKSIRIGAGNKEAPTTIRGSLAGYGVKTEDYVLVEGSICGLRRVVAGRYNYIQGTVVGDDVELGEGSVVVGSILARRLVLRAKTTIRGHIICEKILDSRGYPALVLPPIRLDGVLACDQSLELTGESQIKGIITTRDVYVASSSPIYVIMSKGFVRLSKNCYVQYVQCGRLAVDGGTKVAFAYVKKWAYLGDSAEIGFLSCGVGINGIGEEVKLWNPTLVSWHRRPTVKSQFWIMKQVYSEANALGITSEGSVVLSKSTTGALYTNLINENLLAAISELTQEELSLPNSMQ